MPSLGIISVYGDSFRNHTLKADVDGFLLEDLNMTAQNHDENAPLLGDVSDNFSPDSYSPLVNEIHNDSDFKNVLQSALQAIESGILPERIYQGSSGSYFVKNANGVCLLLKILFFSPTSCLNFHYLRQPFHKKHGLSVVFAKLIDPTLSTNITYHTMVS